ncbi:hypothetical protein A6F68_01379 [Tsuneonella dongtanensis]|uniref:Uncharacterized protein n=1 Tax=Tsuneonella dongtanensis TaxID=692370 RepID=A0A1B2ACW4_9SPHN|nr:hypothetical protein [Tsuneonella dongtanensis]ANY19895.1 hypothetical protein A6F68_01379 [Tsuneonella dongtanensis]
MHPSFALLAPLALLVPTLGASESAPEPVAVEREAIEVVDFVDGVNVRQVRIEQRVTIRIAPRDPAIRPSMLAEMAPDAAAPAKLSERKMGKCVPVSGIAAVQADAGGRLLLFMRDQRLVAASLEKACHARDFYSGFYLERTGDGLLCIERDKLHSRAGASCAISRMRQLVATDD